MSLNFSANAILLSPDKSTIGAVLAQEYLAGDVLAGKAMEDYEKENETMDDFPFKVGDKVFFFQITLYYVGEVTHIGRGWVRLKDASWIHWTGRVSSLFNTYDLTQQHGNRKPRTEYLGDFIVWLQAGVGCKIWEGELPKESQI